MIHQLYLKQVEAWKERYLDKNTPSGLNQKDFANFVDLVRDTFSSRHQDTIELLEAEIERKKGMKKDPSYELEGAKAIHELERDAYNSAIDEDIAYLEEQLALIQKET